MMNELKLAFAAAAKEFGADGYEVSIRSSEEAGAEALRDEISSLTYACSGSMTVRCVKNGKSGYASSELVTPEAAYRLVEQACANAEAIDEADVLGLFAGSEAYETMDEVQPELPSAEQLREDTLALQRLTYAASDKIVDGTQSGVSGKRQKNVLFSSAGLDLQYDCALVYRVVAAAVKDGDHADDDYRFIDVRKEAPEETVRKTVESALCKLGAETVDSGKYNLILSKGALRSLLSTYDTVFSARSAYLKTTLLAGREGELVAAPCVTLVDDPFHPEKFSHCPYDGEGVAVSRKNVIENGVLNTLLYNRMYAHLLGRETTGNAASAKHIVPKGLYFAPGEATEEELLAQLGDGLYISSVTGLHAGANTQSGDFSLQAEGFVVEGGKKIRPAKNFTVADNFFKLLTKIAAFSNRVEFGPGSAVGAPEALVMDISVSGK